MDLLYSFEGPTTDNVASPDAPHLYLQFDEFELPVIASSPTLSVALDLLRKHQVRSSSCGSCVRAREGCVGAWGAWGRACDGHGDGDGDW
jgi:hypothetical protein